MSYKRSQYGSRQTDNRTKYNNSPTAAKPATYVAPSSQPQPAKQTPRPAEVVVEPGRQVNVGTIFSQILSVFLSILSYSPIKASLAKKERKLVVIKVFGFEWMDVEWTDLLLIILLVVVNVLIDQVLVWFHLSLTTEYYLAALGILLVLVISLVFLDRHGYKYPVMVGVNIAAMLGMYFDMKSMKNGNSFIFVSAFVLVYKFVVEPAIEGVTRLFHPTKQTDAPAQSSEPIPQTAATPEPVAPAVMSYDDAVKVIKSKVIGAQGNWLAYREAMVKTFLANYPQVDVKSIIPDLGTAIKDWNGGTYDQLLELFGITDNIVLPNIESAPAPIQDTNPVSKFLDTKSATDRVLKLVTDWPSPLTPQLVSERRTALRDIVEEYADMAGESPIDVMNKFGQPSFAEKQKWDFTWKRLFDIISDAIEEMEEDAEEVSPVSVVVEEPRQDVKLQVPEGTEGLTVWQLVLQKVGWSTTPAAKTAFTKAILNKVATELGWPADDEDNYAKMWLVIKESSPYQSPFDKRDASVRSQANEATAEWLLSQVPQPA